MTKTVTVFKSAYNVYILPRPSDFCFAYQNVRHLPLDSDVAIYILHKPMNEFMKT